MSSGVLEDYLSQVGAALPFGPRMRRRIVWEIESYLLEMVDHRTAKGASNTEAALEAIARYGAPEDVARSFAQARGFTAEPTVITRVGGLAGIAAGLLLGTAVLVQTLLSWSLVWPDRVAVAGGVAAVIATGALHMRQRATYRGIERWNVHLVAIGFATALASAVTWFTAGGVAAFILLGTGFVTMGSASYRASVVPRRAVLLLVAGSTIAIPINGLHEMATPHSPPSTFKELMVLCCLLAVTAAWLPIGSTLWRERLPQDPKTPAMATEEPATSRAG